MNLSPAWAEYLENTGIAAEHWTSLGYAKAPDRLIMAYAREHGFIVFTHDLDFGNILAVTHALGPSVVQVRTQDPVTESVGELVVAAIREYAALLQRGALVTVDRDRRRARILPIVPGMKR